MKPYRSNQYALPARDGAAEACGDAFTFEGVPITSIPETPRLDARPTGGEE